MTLAKLHDYYDMNFIESWKNKDLKNCYWSNDLDDVSDKIKEKEFNKDKSNISITISTSNSVFLVNISFKYLFLKDMDITFPPRRKRSREN